MNARESRFWMANDLEIKEMKKIEMNVANSHQKGGSSAGRFDRIFENKRDRNNTYQVETILKTYYDFDTNRPKVAGFIIGGAAETRSRVFGSSELNIINDYIVTNIPWLNSDPYTLYEETRDARETYEKQKTQKIKLEVEELIDRNPDQVCFGIKEVSKNVDLHLLRKCYVSSDHDDLRNLSNLNAIIKGKCDLIVVEDDWLSKWGNCIGIFMNNSKAISEEDEEEGTPEQSI